MNKVNRDAFGRAAPRFISKKTGDNIVDSPNARVWFDGVEWTFPEFSKTAVDKAGRRLARPTAPWSIEDWEVENDLTIVNNRRWAHNRPLNTFKVGLRQKAKQIDQKCTCVQRLKRLPSILNKLSSGTTRLSQMQDIAGCRAVMRSVRTAYRLVAAYGASRMKHELSHVDDYIHSPRSSGYRGVHLIYSYQNDAVPNFNGLFVEIQIRSKLQHCWATAVETVDAFTGQDLKRGNGREDWARFFVLMGEYLAIHEYGPPTAITKSLRQLKKRIRGCEKKIKAAEHLNAFGAAVLHLPRKRSAGYYLLELNTISRTIDVTFYAPKYSEEANRDLVSIERKIAGDKEHDVVLVAADSLSAIRRGFPNYFGDTTMFIEAIRDATR